MLGIRILRKPNSVVSFIHLRGCKLENTDLSQKLHLRAATTH